MKKLFVLLLSWVVGQLLSGCAVYMPMQCAAPQITDEKQGEVTGSTYLNGRYEVSGTYSPVRHLLLRGAYSTRPDNTNDSTYYRSRQYEVAAGTYWALGSQGLLGGLGGVGQAHSEARYRNDGQIIFFGQRVQHMFDAHYNRLFAEVYGSFQASEAFSMGAAYRVTRVHFTSLMDENVALGFRNMTRNEPMLFFRVRFGSGPTDTRPIQLQMAFGTSSTFGYKTGMTADPYYQIQKPRGYISMGISLFPHCLIHR